MELIPPGKEVASQKGNSQAISNATVSATRIDGSVVERSGVEVSVIIGAPDTN